MKQVGLLTIEQVDLLTGQTISDNWYYNPILDCNDDYIISQEEINATTKTEFLWVKQLPLIEYCVKPSPSPSGSTENYVGS